MATQPACERATQSAETLYPSPRYAWYVVGVLTLMYVFSFIDRQIFSLIVGPLSRDLRITDTEVSVLQGFIFAVFYTFCGIPLGRMADKYSRRGIIACGLVAWSGFTTMCGLAKNFGQMLAWRMGVGVGEAALSPSAYSIITDYFPREKLATAISVYSMGIYIGSGMSYLLGGIVVRFASAKELWTLPVAGAVRPWQLIFLAVGLPGLLATALLFTVREPLRRGIAANAVATSARQSFACIFQNRRTFLCHNIGFGLLSLVSYANGLGCPNSSGASITGTFRPSAWSTARWSPFSDLSESWAPAASPISSAPAAHYRPTCWWACSSPCFGFRSTFSCSWLPAAVGPFCGWRRPVFSPPRRSASYRPPSSR